MRFPQARWLITMMHRGQSGSLVLRASITSKVISGNQATSEWVDRDSTRPIDAVQLPAAWDLTSSRSTLQATILQSCSKMVLLAITVSVNAWAQSLRFSLKLKWIHREAWFLMKTPARHLRVLSTTPKTRWLKERNWFCKIISRTSLWITTCIAPAVSVPSIQSKCLTWIANTTTSSTSSRTAMRSCLRSRSSPAGATSYTRPLLESMLSVTQLLPTRPWTTRTTGLFQMTHPLRRGMWDPSTPFKTAPTRTSSGLDSSVTLYRAMHLEPSMQASRTRTHCKPMGMTKIQTESEPIRTLCTCSNSSNRNPVKVTRCRSTRPQTKMTPWDT